MKKRIFLVFICLCMVVFTFPVTAFAQDVDDLLADPVCTCETQCTEDAVDENCPVCSAGGRIFPPARERRPQTRCAPVRLSVPKIRWIKTVPSARRTVRIFLLAWE